MDKLEGAMFHFNCENRDLDTFQRMLDHISHEFESVLKNLRWVSLGGGVLFTADDYPLERFAQTLKEFSARHDVQVYLEPGVLLFGEKLTLINRIGILLGGISLVMVEWRE